MTQNLRLAFDGTAATGLTAANSNIASSYTSASPLIIDATQPYNQSADNYYSWGSGKNSNTDIAKEDVEKYLSRIAEKEAYGVYYSWYVATAGSGTYELSSGTAQYDICPKNWRLPNGSTSSNKSWWNLIVNSYKLIVKQGEQGDTTVNDILLNDPFSLEYSGYINQQTGAISMVGMHALYWSNTAVTKERGNPLDFRGTETFPSGGTPKNMGASIRCVTK